jgi:hypothetical protein
MMFRFHMTGVGGAYGTYRRVGVYGLACLSPAGHRVSVGKI